MPALAIADAMVLEDPRIEPYFVGAERGVEAQVLPRRQWRYTLLPFEPLYRRQWWKNVRFPWTAFKSLRGVRRILREEQPVLAIGTGGYASGPALWAASGRGIPIVLQEQNAFPGIATRRLAGKAAQIHLGFPEARGHLKIGAGTEVRDSGNPITPPLDPRPDRAAARRALGLDPDSRVVLVAGGSQGALPINEAVAAAIESGAFPIPGTSLIWQTGRGSFPRFSVLIKPGMRMEPFIDPMAGAYAAADLVVARAGAMTLAELAAWGLPSVLVPLPTAAAGHQLTNARAMAASGAAVLLEQHNLTGPVLADTVRELLSQPARMAELSRGAESRANPLAASEIAHEALRLVSKS